MASTVLRLPEVKARTGLSRSSIYLHMKDDGFPQKVQLGPRTVGWLEDEIDAWLELRVKMSRREQEAA